MKIIFGFTQRKFEVFLEYVEKLNMIMPINMISSTSKFFQDHLN